MYIKIASYVLNLSSTKDVIKDYKKWIYKKIATHVSSRCIEFSFAKLYLGLGVSCIHF